jgi:hypothetical protein
MATRWATCKISKFMTLLFQNNRTEQNCTDLSMKKIFNIFLLYTDHGLGHFWPKGHAIYNFSRGSVVMLLAKFLKRFKRRSYCTSKSIYTYWTLGRVIIDLRGMIYITFVEDHKVMLHEKYLCSGHCSFWEDF